MLTRGLITAAAGIALLGLARYRRDLRRDRERLAEFEPPVIDTPFGRVQDAQAGARRAVAEFIGATGHVVPHDSPVLAGRG